jgi:predicted component of type VI protein secretion system
MADRAEQLHSELDALLARYEPTLTEGERADLLRLEQRCGWRPGSRPTRPEPKIRAFLDLFDRAEQQELTDRTVAGGSLDELRRAFRERLAADL